MRGKSIGIAGVVLAIILAVIIMMAVLTMTAIFSVTFIEILLYIPGMEKFLVPVPEYPYLVHAAFAVLTMAGAIAGSGVRVSRAERK